MHGSARRQPSNPLASLQALARMALGATIVLTGCSREADVQAVIAATDAFCAAHPVPALPPSVSANSVYIGAGALTRSWHYWIPERLLREGFAEVESAASIAPYIAGDGQYLRFRVAEAADPGCAGQQALVRHLGPHEGSLMQRRLADQGLRPGQCLAIERVAERRSPYWVEAWDLSASAPDLPPGLPVERHRSRFVATEASTRRVLHEHFSEYGIVNLGMPMPFGCMRRKEWDQLTDTLVRGAGGASTAVAAGPTMIEQPPAIEVLKIDPQIESTRDLGGVKIEGLELSRRRERASASRIDGFELLEGEENDPNATHPDWPRYLQLEVDGAYRRVRLAWLEGDPHGLHDRPVPMLDLGDRIGLFSVTRRLRPDAPSAVDLSWSELARDTGLPVRRVDGAVPIDRDVGFQSLIEDLRRTDDGLRFTLTEVDVQGENFVLLRETQYRWSIE